MDQSVGAARYSLAAYLRNRSRRADVDRLDNETPDLTLLNAVEVRRAMLRYLQMQIDGVTTIVLRAARLKRKVMNSIIYLVGLVVIVLFVLSFLGLR